MKYGMILLTAFMFCSGAAFASDSPKSLWDKNATNDEKKAMLVALGNIEAILVDYTIRKSEKARMAGINALQVCGYDNRTEDVMRGTIDNPDKECYKAVFNAYKGFKKILGDRQRPMVPKFFKGGKAAAEAAPETPAPPPPEAKMIELGSDSGQPEQPQGDGRMITIPGAE